MRFMGTRVQPHTKGQHDSKDGPDRGEDDVCRGTTYFSWVRVMHHVHGRRLPAVPYDTRVCCIYVLLVSSGVRSCGCNVKRVLCDASTFGGNIKRLLCYIRTERGLQLLCGTELEERVSAMCRSNTSRLCQTTTL